MLRDANAERRKNRFSHANLDSVCRQYEGMLTQDQMLRVVRDSISAFVPRDGSGQVEMRLQLVGKCEAGLRRLAELCEETA